jgi:hypothetical protein
LANLDGGLNPGSPAVLADGAGWAAGGVYSGARAPDLDGAADGGAAEETAPFPPRFSRSYWERISGFISVRYASVSCAARVAAISWNSVAEMLHLVRMVAGNFGAEGLLDVVRGRGRLDGQQLIKSLHGSCASAFLEFSHVCGQEARAGAPDP